MALQPFAKASDLQILVPGLTAATAGLHLEVVSGSIRGAVGWDVDRVVGAVYVKRFDSIYYDTCDVVSRTKLTLPMLNLTAISELTIDGIVQDSSLYTFATSGVVTLRRAPGQSVQVTYTAGYARTPTDMVPAVFRAVALEYAAKFSGNPAGVRSYQIGGTSETFADPGALRSLAEEDSRLDAYRVNL